jgi:hypothetical protein
MIDPSGDWAMILDHARPYLVIDNVLRLGDKTRALWAKKELGRNGLYAWSATLEVSTGNLLINYFELLISPH